MMNAFVFWLVLVLLFFLGMDIAARMLSTRLAAAKKRASFTPLASTILGDLEDRLEPMVEIVGHRMNDKVFEFEGVLRGPAEEMFRRIRDAFAGEPVTPLLLEGDGSSVRVLLLRSRKETAEDEYRPNWGMHGLLLLATLCTTTWAGALHAGVNLLHHPEHFTVGLPYSLALLLILGSHELGHYLTARYYEIRVTPPYFIPVPFALGTFGAFINIKSLTPNRRALFDVAVAGPLAGLVFAIPALVVGLRYSRVIAGAGAESLGQMGVNIDSSVLMACLAKLSLGASVFEGHRLVLHPLAFAGWLGLIVTALNLLPIGQLDGGHISHAMLGSHRAHGVSVAGLTSLLLLALFVWPGLMLWAFIVFFIAGTHDSPAANDVTPIGLPRKALGYFTFLILLLIIIPVPHALYEVITIHTPYL